MGCPCKKKPTPTPEPETIEKFHAKEMNKFAEQIQKESDDWFNNLDTIKPIDDDE